jgi:succinate---hydroxymethylglutarate CoA-transferase
MLSGTLTAKRLISSGPLNGVRVLDLSRVLAGPYCTQILGDMGADVIKIEHPSGDDTRRWGPPYRHGESAYFISCNRNKLSVTLNMKVKESSDILLKLVQRSDVLVHNFVTGGAESLGLGYDKVSSMNPQIIYCAISGFGSTGIYASKPGYDALISAMYGMQHITGPENGPPTRPGVAVTDVLTGILSYGAICAALYERKTSGLGQKIDTSLMEAQLSSLVNIASSYLVTGKDSSRRWGTAHPSIVPYQNFLCSDGGYVSVAVGNDSQFSLFCQSLYDTKLLSEQEIHQLFDLPVSLANLRPKSEYQTNPDRVRNRVALIQTLQGIFQKESLAYWIAVLDQKGFPIGPVRNIEDSFTCPQALERGMVQEIDHPTCGKLAVVGPPIKFSRTPCSIRLPPPLLGQHSRQVLRDLLEYSDSEIDQYVQCGAISEREDSEATQNK